jgi:hypothetical protein
MEANETVIEANDDAVLALEDASVQGGDTNGLFMRGRSQVILDRCFVAENLGVGVRLENSSSVTAYNSLFVVNGGSDSGGAFRLRHSETSLRAVNCTVADNDGGSQPGVVWDEEEGATLELVNLLLWSNGEPAVDQCQGCILGADSLGGTTDPSFVVGAGRVGVDDYQIQSDSPARDRGTSAGDVPEIDYWGDPRDDGSIDTGADEVSD